ncbi:unnamed protein product [Prorocentrum cordatum]|uniref:Uncharacterized protein n=1 Tax=Prorocentrum cordatum TaxID=2364126 RepID=A0ABN9SME8_9DINO|nr:unnamed protein product [Polarella glacialis]
MPSTSFVQIRQAGARAGAQQLGHGAPLGAEAQLAELLGQQRRVQATPRRRPLQAPTAARRAVRQPRRRQAGRQADAGPQPGGEGQREGGSLFLMFIDSGKHVLRMRRPRKRGH